MAAVRRIFLAIALNIVIPGPGLTLVGRPWVGVGLTIWFAVCAELALFGLLIAPATLPHWLSLVAAGAAVLAWLVGQGLLAARIRFLRSANLPRQLAILGRLAERAITHGDYRTAQAAISVALSMDDTDGPTHLLRARLAECRGHLWAARRARQTASRLGAEKAEPPPRDPVEAGETD